MAELQTRQPIDTEALQKLIAKVKKGDAENAEAIQSLAEKIGDAISYSEFDVYNESDEIVIKKVTF